MIKDFNDKRSISAYSVAPIDPNQITTHLLSTIFTYLRHTKGPLNVSGRAPPGSLCFWFDAV